MKTANEIATITEKACLERIAKRHDSTMNFINYSLAPGIEDAAKRGDTEVRYNVGPDLDRDLIVRVFSAQGYDVKYRGYLVTISWLNVYLKMTTNSN